MLDDDIVTVPAGWYPDPMGLPQLRWWDNYAWTEFTSAARSPLIMQDEPKLAYADDDLPSRRSQREQRDRTQQDGARQQAANSVDLATTLRQLEPPKPQSVERNQPAPTMADAPASTPTEQTPFASAFEPLPTQPASEADYDPFAAFLAEPSTTPEQHETSRSAGFADQATSDPEFGQQAQFGEQTGYANQTGYNDTAAASGFSQPQPATQHAQEQAYVREQYGADQYGSERFGTEQYGADKFAAEQFAAERDRRQYSYGQSRIGVHAPLAYTPFVWIIAMIPLIQLVGILLVVSAVDVAMALPFLLVIAGGPYVATIPLALADRRQLLRMGHNHPAHWAWSILTAPAYLVARAIAASREHGKGLTPLLVWASLSLLQVASIIAVPGILISAMPAVFSAEVEESIEADSAIAGRELAVDCPATPPVQIGGTFNCTGVLATTGEEVGIVVRLQRANGWIDWRVYGMVWDNATAEAPATDQPASEEPVDAVVEGAVTEG